MGRLIKNSNDGRFESVSNTMKHIRKPVFVDNAVHYVDITKTTNPFLNFQTPKTINSFQVMPDTTYSIVEGESFVRITHKGVDGHNTSIIPFFNNESISNSNKPTLLYNPNFPSQRLLPSTIDGNIINLTNMKI